jgi:glycosyltransferase involved in cell wall biosynthesis
MGGVSRSLRIEGWRGVNHSYALVNQYQIRELMKCPGLQLFHRDLPFALPHWNRTANTAGFSADEQAAMDAIADDTEDAADCIYRICSPFRMDESAADRKLVTFMVTETGLSAVNFVNREQCLAHFTAGDNLIVTPTNWARGRIAEYGFPEERIFIIPHGVDTACYYRIGAEERRLRRQMLDIAEDETVFLNIGVALWNKGVDVLLRAFGIVRSRGHRVRLILKDQSDVYGISVQETIRTTGDVCPELLRVDTLEALSVVRGNLGQAQLRSLYGVSDCYISTYRAEGFNMPVLEAIACGLPLIVTRGGATDDYCDDHVAYRVSGQAGAAGDSEHFIRFIEPDLDEVVEAMSAIAAGGGLDPTSYAASRARILDRLQWAQAATSLAELTVGSVAEPVRQAS